MKTIVIYYSRKGSNKYIAEKISKTLSCDIEAIKPRLDVFLLFLMNIQLGIKSLKNDIKNYDRVILCGPIWVGKFIAPLQSFIKKYKEEINNLVFVTCCGSPYEKKEEKFGHGLVFKEVKILLDEKCQFCQAFPIDLVLPEDQKEVGEILMKTHLNDENFNGEIQEVFDDFISRLSE